jgi:hypothetical protein
VQQHNSLSYSSHFCTYKVAAAFTLSIDMKAACSAQQPKSLAAIVCGCWKKKERKKKLWR